MRTSVAVAGGFLLLGIGYALGSSQILSPALVLAQGKGEAKKDAKPKAGGDLSIPQPDITEETRTKIKTAADALNAAMQALQDESKYTPAIKGVNSFGVLTGGGSAITDLKAGAIVDPETYAALYAGLASDAVAPDLAKDADGRLTYKGQVIRIYPVSKLRAMYQIRAAITGEDLLPAATTDDSGKAKPKPKPAETETEKPESEQN